MDIEQFIDRFGGMSEEYSFYGGEVTLRYYDKEHAYFLMLPDGTEERQDGVTQTCHVIDKSQVLIAWGVKMMYEKALRTVPGTRNEGAVVMSDAEMDKWLLEAKSAHKEKLEDAGQVGHVAHNWIESFIKLKIAHDAELDHTSRAIIDSKIDLHYDNMPADERAKKACIAALEWMRKHNVRWHHTEKKIYSRKYKYAGTMDGLCTCDSCDDPRCCPEPFIDHLSIADWKTSNYLYLEYLLQTAAYSQAYEEESAVTVSDRWIIRLGKEEAEVETWHLGPGTFETDWKAFETALNLVRSIKVLETRIKDRKDGLRAALKVEKDAARATKVLAEGVRKAEAKAERVRKRLELATAKKESALKSKEDKAAAKRSKIPLESITLLESFIGKREPISVEEIPEVMELITAPTLPPPRAETDEELMERLRQRRIERSLQKVLDEATN
jgi:hypothetical protein